MHHYNHISVTLTCSVICSTRVNIYFNPFVVLSCLTVYYFLIIHYYIIILIWIHHYFSVFLLEIYIFLLIFPFHFPLSLKYPVLNFLDFCNFIINVITNQIVSDLFLNCCFWSSFKCICDWFVSMIKKFMALFTD